MPDREPQAEVGAVGRARLRDNQEGLFTSDLTVNEYVLVEDAGFEPLGLVVGSSIYHVGYQRRSIRISHELTVLSEAVYHARELAMERMTSEAEALDADGVVGVRLQVKGFQNGGHVAEFLAVGTAVRKREGERHRPAHGRPFTSDLSGQDFWTLLRTGSRPVGSWFSAAASTASRRPRRRQAAECGATSSCQTSLKRSMTPESSR